jgi:hypothetical protein
MTFLHTFLEQRIFFGLSAMYQPFVDLLISGFDVLICIMLLFFHGLTWLLVGLTLSLKLKTSKNMVKDIFSILIFLVSSI